MMPEFLEDLLVVVLEDNATVLLVLKTVLKDQTDLPVLLVLPEMMVNRVRPEKLAWLEKLSLRVMKVDASNAKQDLQDPQAPMDLPDHQVMMVNQEIPELLANQDNPDPLDLKEMLVLQETLVLPVNQDQKEMTELMDVVNLDLKDPLVDLAQLDPPVKMELLDKTVNLDLLDHKDLLAIPVLLEKMVDPVKMVPLVFPVPMLPIVHAHLVLVKLVLLVNQLLLEVMKPLLQLPLKLRLLPQLRLKVDTDIGKRIVSSFSLMK